MFDMYTPAGNELVLRIAVAAQRLLDEQGATMSEVDEFIDVNFKRLADAGYLEVRDQLVLQNVYDFMFGL